MGLYSYPVERHCLGGLIKNSQIFPDIDLFVSEQDFYSDAHQTIYSVIRSTLLKGEKLDKVILAEKIQALGVKFKDEINIFDYIESIAFSQIDAEATIKAFKELSKLRVKREIDETLERAQKNLNNPELDSIDDIISSTDSIVNDKVSSYVQINEAKNIFEDLKQVIEERGSSPVEESGLMTPFKEFNRLYGGLLGGEIYAVASRAGQGKTAWIDNLALHTAKLNNTKALILDTEMPTDRIQFRIAAAISGVPLWYVKTGNWRKNKEMTDKMRAVWPLIEKQNYQFHHYHVANKPIDQVISFIRRWYYQNVGRGNPAIIAYDYLKLTGEKVEKNWAEHQALGEKIDKLKRTAEELNSPIITAIQLNRSGEMHNKFGKEVTDDASAISITDRLSWFAAYLGIFRRKTLDEIQLDGAEFGTHKLVTLKAREQGKDAAGHHDIVKRILPDGSLKYMNNYLNFSIDNFNISEHGSLHDIAQKASLIYNFKGKPKLDGDLQ